MSERKSRLFLSDAAAQGVGHIRKSNPIRGGRGVKIKLRPGILFEPAIFFARTRMKCKACAFRRARGSALLRGICSVASGGAAFLTGALPG
jgi:hypothetical protein